MKIEFTLKKEQQSKSLVILSFEDEKLVGTKNSQFNLDQITKTKEFKGKKGEIYVLPILNDQDAKHLILVGLGKNKDFKGLALRKTVSVLVKLLGSKKISEVDLLWPESLAKKYKDSALFLKLLIKNIYLTGYKFDEYQTKDKDEEVYELKSVNIIGLSSNAKLNKVIQETKIVSQAICFTRDLNNSPSNKVTPQYFVKQAKEIAAVNKQLKLKILTVAEMKKLGMGGLLGVSSGSQHNPEFIVLEYLNGPKSQKPVVYVGKTITFDSGGISLKPGDGMDEMKMDMSGGGAVLGAIKAISELNLKTNVVGLIPACENMPSGTAYKPGDILRAMNKKTIEVLNTDAEGRIILADALSYAKDYDPKYVVDLATLTGACMIALGNLRAGLFGNDKKIIDKVNKVGETNEEFCWPMPLDDEYTELIKSKIADVSNIASTRYGGAITAAAFLQKFVDYSWVHIDIAPVAFSGSEGSGLNHGASGFGVDLLVELLK